MNGPRHRLTLHMASQWTLTSTVVCAFLLVILDMELAPEIRHKTSLKEKLLSTVHPDS